MSEQLPPPPAWVSARALDLIGLRALDMSDPLHVELARSIYELGQGAPDGVVLQRIRWHFAWHLKAAGQEFATAKLAYENHVDKRTVELRAGEKPPSRAEAEQIARAEDDAYTAKLRYLLAEQKERAMRKLLDSVESAIDLYRTARADERKADATHAHGYGGGV